MAANKPKTKSPFWQDLRELDRPVRITFWIINVMVIFLMAQQNLDSPNITQIGQDFGLTRQEIDEKIGGEAYMATMIISSISLLLFGYLADKVNRKILLLITVGISGLSYLIAPFSANPDQFIIIRSLAGIGIGGVVPILFSVIGDIFSEKSRAAASGIFMGVLNVGLGFGFILGSLLGTEESLGWKGSFYIQSLILLIITLILVVYGKFPKRGQAESTIHDAIASGKVEYKERIKISDLKNILSNRTNLIFIIFSIVGTLPMGFIQRFMVDYYSEDIGLGAFMSTLFLLLVLSGTIMGDVIGGVFGDVLRKRGRQLPIHFSFVVSLLGCGLFYVFFSFDIPFQPGITILLLPILTGFIAASLVEASVPISKAITLNVNVPENRGTISALIQTTAQLGFGFGALIGVFGPNVAEWLGIEWTRLFNFKLAIIVWMFPSISWVLLLFTANKDEDKLTKIMKERAKKYTQNNPE